MALSRYPLTDPLHDRSGPDTFWTTVNAAEALPGVSTPLNWSWFGDAVERAFRWTFVDMGVLHPAATVVPASVDDRMWGCFYGRAAANLDTFRRLGDLTPEGFAKTGLPRREGGRLLIDNPPWPRRLSIHEKD